MALPKIQVQHQDGETKPLGGLIVDDGESVVLRGFPEHVQQIADAIDQYLPGKIVWDQHAEPCPSGIIVLKGWDAAPSKGGEIDNKAA